MKSGVILFCIYYYKHAHFFVAVFASLLMNIYTFRIATLGFHLLIHEQQVHSQALGSVLVVTRQSQFLPLWM